MAELSPKEFVAHSGISHATLKAWRRKDYGPPYFRRGGRIFYDTEDFAAWKAEHKVYPSKSVFPINR